MRRTARSASEAIAATLWRCGGRQCGSGDGEHDDGEVHRDAVGAGPAYAPPIVRQVIGSGGTSLPDSTRLDMARRLGHDFADVKIHTDARAGQSALEVAARAYTVEKHVVFAPGEYQPENADGARLLAHELVHTLQPVAGRSGRISDPTEPAEREAAAVAERAVSDNGSSEAAHTVQQSQPGLARLPFGIRLPGAARGMDAAEISLASGVYGTSIDYSKVLITDAVGGGGRPFTTVVPIGGYIAMNLGSGPYTTPASDPDLLIHELGHVWQSQHHPNPAAYMANSIASQAGASAAGGDAYCYVPGKPFAEYGAEQLAQQSERGVAAIRAHMRGVTAGVPDPANIVAMAVPRWETRGAPGVRC